MFKDEASKSVIDNTNQRWCFITVKIDNFVKYISIKEQTWMQRLLR